MTMTTTHVRARSSSFGSNVRTLIAALILALVVQLFFVQSAIVPSVSMEPTLVTGDHLIIDKLAYGYSRYSFSYPGLGLDEGVVAFSGRFAASSPKRGDLVVFRDPSRKGVDDVKRLIGLPGDKVEIRAGNLIVNGETIERNQVSAAPATDSFGQTKPARELVEALSSRVSYHIRSFGDQGSLNNTMVFEVPAGRYFVLGDNRDVSIDSRFPEIGMIPADNLIGRAILVLYNDNSPEPLWQVWTWGNRFRADRLFKLP